MKRKRSLILILCLAVAAAVLLGGWLSFFGTSREAPSFVATLNSSSSQLPALKRSDSLLIVAPHPDDECIAAGGLIQQAVAAGARVHVLYLTYGDNHELAYWALRKIPALTSWQYRSLGEQRRREAIRGMEALGLSADDLTFLGYPDSGTLRIWETTWKPGTSRFHGATGTRSVPYADALSPEAPYNAGSILQDFETVIRSCRPTIVVFPSPLDLNPDHQAAYLFTTSALLDLKSTPLRYLYLVHQRKFPLPRFYNPYAFLVPPDFMAGLPVTLRNLKLTPDQVNAKYHATLLYQSQIDVSRQLLVSFCRHNEVYMLDQRMSLAKSETSFSLIPSDFLLAQFGHEFALRAASTRWIAGAALQLKLSFSTAPSKGSVIRLSVFPFAPGIPFAGQPKLSITLQHGKRPVVQDLTLEQPVTDAITVREHGSDVTVTVGAPLIPSHATTLLLHVQAGFRGLSFYSIPWQVVSLPQR